MKPASVRKGLTLVEILISLSIFSFVGLAVYGLLRTGLHTREKILDPSVSVGQQYLDLEHLAQEVRTAFTFRAADPGFSGDSKTIHFYCTSFDYKEGVPCVKRVGYAFVKDELIKQEYEALSGKQEREFSFITNLKNVDFAYFAEDGQWIDRWPPGDGEEGGDGFSLDEEIYDDERDGRLSQTKATDTLQGKAQLLPRAVRLDVVFSLGSKDVTFSKYVFLYRQ